MKKYTRILIAVLGSAAIFLSVSAASAVNEVEVQLITDAILMKFHDSVSCTVMNAYAGMILNRTADRRFPDATADVILSLGYSGNIADIDEDLPESQKIRRLARDAAKSALLGVDSSNGALWCTTADSGETVIGKTPSLCAEGYTFWK